TALISAETGVAKEQFAHAIHNANITKNENFVSLNCAAIPKDLIESELFGYEEGAFTGANKGGNVGKYEQAEGGTLLLDEISEMPLDVKAKILCVIQKRELDKTGGHVKIPLNIRIIAASNQDLKSKVAKVDFTEDLYYRLNVIPLTIP